MMMEERTMKKHILSLAILLAAGGYAFGQTVYLSEIKVTNREVTKTADRQANVSMELNLDELDMKRQHSLRLTPVILSADGSQEAELPPVVINGKVRDRVLQRVETLDHVRLNPDAIAVVRRKNGSEQTVEYTASVPFKRWMIGGNIQLRGQVIGCALCNEGGETATTGDIFPPMNPTYYKPFIAPKEEVVKRRSETRAAHIQFRQDSHRIDPNYLNNRSELDSVHHSIEVVKDNDDLTITGIYVTGYASPEGKFDYNMNLSERRAKAFTEYVKKDMENIDPAIYHVAWKGEDWEGLRREVEKRPQLLKQNEVLDIIDNCGGDKDACEEQLKALVPPEIYQRLLNEMYPPVRRNEYRVEYNVRHFTIEEGRKMIQSRPDLMSVSEIQQVADSYGKGTPEYTECLLAGVKGHPTDVTALNNAALALIEANRAAEAAEILERAPQDGALQNMLGAAYISMGETAKAEAAFRRAAEAGYTQASDNLNQLLRYNEYMAE